MSPGAMMYRSSTWRSGLPGRVGVRHPEASLASSQVEPTCEATVSSK
jgi:hypothetical protein